MNDCLHPAREIAAELFIESGRKGTLYVTLSADDLLDADLYGEGSALAFVAEQTVLVLDETVATMDGGVLIVCLRELRARGFRFDAASVARSMIPVAA